MSQTGQNGQTQNSKEIKKLKIELPTEQELQNAIAQSHLDALAKANKPKANKLENPTNLEKKNNLTSKEETVAALDDVKAGAVLAQGEKTIPQKSSLQDIYNKAGEKTSTDDADGKPDEEKGFLDNLKDFAVDNGKRIVGGGLAIWAASKIKSWFSDDKKEDEKPWYKNTWLWAGGTAVAGWFARDKYGKDAFEKEKNTFLLKKKIEFTTSGVTEKFLLGILDNPEYAKELDDAKPEDLEAKFTEIAKRENEKKNSGVTWAAAALALKTIFATPLNEKDGEEKTEEQIQAEKDAHHDAVNQGQYQVETMNFEKDPERQLTQKDIELQRQHIYKDRIDQSQTDRSINKEKIKSAFANAVDMVQIIGSRKGTKAGVLEFPTMTNNMITKLLEMMEYMKDKKEYKEVAAGIRAILITNDQKIPEMPTNESLLDSISDKDKLEAGRNNCKTDEEITKYLGGIYRSKEYSDKYNSAMNNWYDQIGLIVKNTDPKIKYQLKTETVQKMKDLGDDLYGHGLFDVNDMRVDQYGSLIAGIGGTIAGGLGVAAGTALDLTLIGAPAGIPLQIGSAMLVSGSIAALTTRGASEAMGQDYTARDGIGDFALNAIPGGALAKIGKNASKVAGLTGKMATAAEIGIMGLSGATSGMISSRIKTGERQAGSNMGISMALAMIPYGLGKLGSKFGSIKMPAGITNFTNSVINKFIPQSSKLMLAFRKHQLTYILRGKNGLSDEAKKILISDSQKLSKEMQEDIGKYISNLESQGLTKEAEEIKIFLGQAGITEIKFHKTIKQASELIKLKESNDLRKKLLLEYIKDKQISGNRLSQIQDKISKLAPNMSLDLQDDINKLEQSIKLNKPTGKTLQEAELAIQEMKELQGHELSKPVSQNSKALKSDIEEKGSINYSELVTNTEKTYKEVFSKMSTTEIGKLNDELKNLMSKGKHILSLDGEKYIYQIEKGEIAFYNIKDKAINPANAISKLSNAPMYQKMMITMENSQLSKISDILKSFLEKNISKNQNAYDALKGELGGRSEQKLQILKRLTIGELIGKIQLNKFKLETNLQTSKYILDKMTRIPVVGKIGYKFANLDNILRTYTLVFGFGGLAKNLLSGEFGESMDNIDNILIGAIPNAPAKILAMIADATDII